MNQQEFAAYLERKAGDRDFSDWRLFATLNRLPTQLLRAVLAMDYNIEITDMSEELKSETLRVVEELRDSRDSLDPSEALKTFYQTRNFIQDLIILRNGQVCGNFTTPVRIDNKRHLAHPQAGNKRRRRLEISPILFPMTVTSSTETDDEVVEQSGHITRSL